MTQAINIYISESGQLDANSGINASVSQQPPSPKDNRFDGVINDSGVPTPEMFSDEIGYTLSVGSVDVVPVPEGVGTTSTLGDNNRATYLSAPTPENNNAPAPFPGENMGRGSAEIGGVQLPMPTLEPKLSASFNGIPEPEDFDENARKTTDRKPKKPD
jgi:hypothetical protein